MEPMMAGLECEGLSPWLARDRLSEMVSAYLKGYGITRLAAEVREVAALGPGWADDVAERVFGLLTHRDFCYLGRSRVEGYRRPVVEAFRGRVERGEPLVLFYDLGGGYHASLRRDWRELMFRVGLGEWFVLSQIGRFLDRLQRFYLPGAEFRIVIDNLCAWAVNDIPIARTEAYVSQFRRLIAAVRLERVVGLLVESEVLDWGDYAEAVERELRVVEVGPITNQEKANVERFLGRACDGSEAEWRVARYRAAGRVSDRLIAPWITGPRLTQRASDRTLCFRPFPGGDSRIQAGQVGLVLDGDGELRPVLVTDRNVDRLRWVSLDPPPPLPAEVGVVMVGMSGPAASG
ncbi:MAG: hypothetical protein KatS3mg108_1833 [Isosphaeraceae bacterium]|jgi:hypothetical protein|nr:MAG: hypothetical protein KatS3mg108_1833 [Isosphaeraceae bacterium]